jgi:UDP-glucuronate 4-epimerase
MQRDFTYIDDIVEGVIRLLDRTAQADPAFDSSISDPSRSAAPYRLYNIGNNQPVELLRFIEVIEEAIGRKATKNMLPMQEGDVPATYADIDDLRNEVGFSPSTPIEEGVARYVVWYRSYYGV